MKNLKKVLAFVVVFAMMFTFAVSANTFPDVAETASYAEAVNILSSLGLMIGDENGNFNPDKILTRAEAATLVVRFRGLESAAEGAKGATQFTDVAADHWASGFINIATQTGIIVGMGDGTFRPEDQVTYEQIVKMIVAALGYTPLANAQGGYPTGYLVVASRKGITKGATGSAGEPAPRSTVARLLYNALEVPTMEQTVFSEGNEEYEESEKSVLTDNLDYEKYEGTVTAAYPAASGDTGAKTTVDIAPESMLSADLQGKDWDKVEKQAKKNLSKIDVGDTNAADLVGYYVTVYVGEDENTGKDKIFAIAAKSNINETITIDYSQLDEDINFGAKPYVYYMEKATDKTAKKIKLNDETEYYYNGGQGTVGGQTSEELAKEFIEQAMNDEVRPGSVTFVDSMDGDDHDGYDFVFVTEYTNDYVVEEIDGDKITDAINGDTVDIDLESEKDVYTFVKDGQPAQYEDIQEGDVLTFAEGVDDLTSNNLIKVYISSKTLEGSVSEKRSDDNEAYYTIGSKEYRASISDSEVVKVGDEGTFYLNVDDRIVYEDATSTIGGNYVYLFKAAKKDGGVDKNAVQLKYIKADGTWETKNLAKTIAIYDGEDSTSGIKPANVTDDKAEVVEKLFSIDGDKCIDGLKDGLANEEKLVKFATNGSGEIKTIYLADNDQNKKCFSMDGKAIEKTYNQSKNKIDKIYLKDDITVFNVKTEKMDDEDGYSVSTAKATFKDDNEYTVYAFDEDNAGYPAVILAFDASAKITDDTPVLVIDRVTSSTNEEGTEIYKVYGYQEGEAVSAETSEDLDGAIDPEVLEAGDVIIFSLDADNKIDDIKILFTTAEAEEFIADGNYGVDKSVENDDVEEDFGQVIKKSSGSRIEFASGNDWPLTGKDVYFYTVNLNRSKTVVETASYSDITANEKSGKLGSFVYVRYYDGAAVAAVAYQKTLD